MPTTNLLSAELTLNAEQTTAQCRGCWQATGVVQLAKQWQQFDWPDRGALTIDAGEIERLDSAGAWLLRKITLHLQAKGVETQLQGFSSEQQILIDLVFSKVEETDAPPQKTSLNWVARIGQVTVLGWQQMLEFLGFIGEIFLILCRALRHPRHIQVPLMLKAIEMTGYRAMPIVALLSFLIGVVLAYQMGLQLETYGAAIYVADLLGVAILREFGPLITAIIIAGRTGSAFTAEIGTMKVNEEIDALRTMGLSPVDFLVIPKMLAMMIVMPLLILLADIMGIFGGMVMSNRLFDLSFSSFIGRFHEVVGLNNYIFGLIKAPVFAMIIATVGCFQGFRVGGSADSVGVQTTISVVQAIFLIIIADAFFSIVYSFSGV